MNRRVLSVAGKVAGGIASVAAMLGIWFSGVAWGARTSPWIGILTLCGAVIFLGFTLTIYRMDQLGRSLDDHERERTNDHEALTNFAGKQFADMAKVLQPLSDYVVAELAARERPPRPTSIVSRREGD